MNISVKRIGTHLDHSGYGSANRANTTALYVSGVDITLEIIHQVSESAEHGWTGELCKSLLWRNIDYKINMIHLTPDMYPRYIEDGKYNIGELFWETDRLPKEWIEPINKMQEIWTSSSAMADLFRASGVKVPIYWFPQPVDTAEADKKWDKFDIDGHKGFMFYSIFQWIERKNPRGLLQAYWEAFSGRNDVSLLLKTYRISYTQDDYEKIQQDIEKWKRELRLVHFPRIILTTKLLSHEDIMRVHQTGDCYVTADHGEGWCRPLQEALLMGKPTIATARGGIHEYISSDHYYPIDSTYVPVVQQPWIPWYTSDQNWAQIDREEMKKKMQLVFNNKEMAMIKGFKAKEYIKEHFSYQKIGMMMKDRLEKIARVL
ncbi:MAG: glycosyltransferase [Patescibacteria group bacterium]